MSFHRFWWFALLAVIATLLIGQQVLTKNIAVLAQNTSSPTTYPATWVAFVQPNKNELTTLYSDAESACKGYENGDDHVKVKYNRLKIYKFENTNVVAGATCYMDLFLDGKLYDRPEKIIKIGCLKGKDNPDFGATLITDDKATRGTCFNFTQVNNTQPDYSPCTYYDDIANRYGCKYHSAAATICRNNYTGVTIENETCRLFTGQPTEPQLNCVRSCLVQADKIAQSTLPSCLTQSGQKHCTKLSCINSYHNSCFSKCGVPVDCYGGNSLVGNWWLDFKYNDDR